MRSEDLFLRILPVLRYKHEFEETLQNIFAHMSFKPFHTDRCDILAMYAYDMTPTGGESLLASNGMIYNEIAAKRPDVIHVLKKDDWVFDEFVSMILCLYGLEKKRLTNTN